MKVVTVLAALTFSTGALAGGVGYIADYDYQVTDVARLGLSKERLFSRLERGMLDLKKSICANRAHLWAYDLFRFHNVNPGKIFIFFGRSMWVNEPEGWMYHVAPYIVDGDEEFVMEASYDDVTRPLTVNEWIENETDGRFKANECIDITAADTDLTEYFYNRYNLPEVRDPGRKSARCYIRRVPGYYVYPTGIALHELKRDEKGNEVEYNPKAFSIEDVLHACVDATQGKKSQCKRYLGY